MPIDNDVKNILLLLEQSGVRDFSELSVAEARNLALLPPPATPTFVADVRDRLIPGPMADIPIRIYQPSNDGVHGALVYFHGGGWVIGNIESHDEICRRLCQRAMVCVISVDYRLAPEHRYPAAVEDCASTVVWVAEHAHELRIDATRIGVGGDSAGGNLAAAVALMLRDQGGPPLRLQLLIYPVTDAVFETGSYRENAEGFLLSRRAMQWFWDHYVPDPADRTLSYAAPLRAPDLEGLPPALIQTAEFDPLRDEGEAFAAALRSAGVDVRATRYEGLIHGYFGLEDAVGAARTAVQEAVDYLKLKLG